MKRLLSGGTIAIAGILACVAFGSAHRRFLAAACDGLLAQFGIQRHVTGVDTPSPIDLVLFAVLCAIAPAGVPPMRRLLTFLTGVPILIAVEVALLTGMLMIASVPNGASRPFLEAVQSIAASSSIVGMPWLVWLFTAEWPRGRAARHASPRSGSETSAPRR